MKCCKVVNGTMTVGDTEEDRAADEVAMRKFMEEYDPDKELEQLDEPVNIYYDNDADEYVIEGSRIDKMMGYTNLESEKGFLFFPSEMLFHQDGLAHKHAREYFPVA